MNQPIAIPSGQRSSVNTAITYTFHNNPPNDSTFCNEFATIFNGLMVHNTDRYYDIRCFPVPPPTAILPTPRSFDSLIQTSDCDVGRNYPSRTKSIPVPNSNIHTPTCPYCGWTIPHVVAGKTECIFVGSPRNQYAVSKAKTRPMGNTYQNENHDTNIDNFGSTSNATIDDDQHGCYPILFRLEI